MCSTSHFIFSVTVELHIFVSMNVPSSPWSNCCLSLLLIWNLHPFFLNGSLCPYSTVFFTKPPGICADVRASDGGVLHKNDRYGQRPRRHHGGEPFSEPLRKLQILQRLFTAMGTVFVCHIDRSRSAWVCKNLHFWYLSCCVHDSALSVLCDVNY